MKKVDTTPIAPTTAYPLSKKEFNFLQSSYAEILAVIAEGLVPEYVTAQRTFVIFGCHITSPSAGVFNITQGYMYDRITAEVYLVQAVSNLAVTDGIVLTITSIYDIGSNPTKFTDGISRNVNASRVLVAKNGVLGSGDIDYFTSAGNPKFIYLNNLPHSTILAEPGFTGGVFATQDQRGELRIVGQVTCTATSVVEMFTLPVGSRPAVQDLHVTAVCNHGGGAADILIIIVFKMDGTVVVPAGGLSPGFVVYFNHTINVSPVVY